MSDNDANRTLVSHRRLIGALLTLTLLLSQAGGAAAVGAIAYYGP